MTLEVRRAHADELDAVGRLTEAAYETFVTGPEDPYRARLRDAGSRDREAQLWVCVEGDAVLGTVTGCPDGSPWREVAAADEGEFRMLAVDDRARGRGVGEALVRRQLELARRAGRRGVALSSLAEMTAAHRLYRRLGFVRVPERDWSPAPGTRLQVFALHW